MVEKMKYVNFAGRIEDMDRVVDKYFAKHEIQLENAEQVLEDSKGLEPFDIANPYTKFVHMAEDMLTLLGILEKAEAGAADTSMEIDRAVEIVSTVSERYDARGASMKPLKDKLENLRAYLERVENFQGLDFQMQDLRVFRFIKVRFGRIPIAGYNQFESFLYDETETLFIKGKTDSEYVWGVYFVPQLSSEKTDELLHSSFNFERVDVDFEIDGEYPQGSPTEVCRVLNEKIEKAEVAVRAIVELVLSELNLTDADLITAYRQLRKEAEYFNVRKSALKTNKDFFVFVGWMPEKDAQSVQNEIRDDERTILIEEGDAVAEPLAAHTSAPTKLVNNRLVKPFEFFVKMYGLPAYGEKDPTLFIAITYTILFGAMFGDLGQGLLLAVGGFLVGKFKKLQLGYIIGTVGISSAVFGLLYGSVFGFEDVLPAVWIHPAEDINTILFATVGFGIFLIFSAMVINMVNACSRKDWGAMFFSANGLAGIVFYASVLVIGYSMFTGAAVPVVLIILLLVLPLLVMAFHEPVMKKLKGEKHVIHGGFGMFIMESIIDMFEVLLSYFTNTVSFVRVGAFALSHAGMMGVVMLLAAGANGGLNPVVLVIGNIFVMALEGLIVGIQGLRLEFYEMFSRFFASGGREFASYRPKI